MYKIMIIEDDLKISEELHSLLSRYGYEPIRLLSFERVIEEVKEAEPDLILMDINLPVYDGYYLCRQVREHSQLPIIMVTSRNSDVDELMSMNLGADDFITKPYNTQILLARISALLKRTYAQESNKVLDVKGVKLDLGKGFITKQGKSAELTKNELRILLLLMKNQGNIVSREEIMTELWQSDEFVDDNTLTVNINRLRRKLEDIGADPDYLQTRRGLGYLI